MMNILRHKRGKKITTKPGARISLDSSKNQTQTEGLDKVTSSTARPTIPLYSSDEDLPLINLVSNSSSKHTSKQEKIGQHENLCSICPCDFRHYVGKDWICCVNCKHSVCGHCNKGTKNARFECPRCDYDD
ncbi:hypothetical protein QE152_g7241 [Popillia japonica]|uniref:RING-type domain-containing protein n=1 Tax=Popillia japonica TaxID=7064 RepID=A0AAW1MGA1_POPJA